MKKKPSRSSKAPAVIIAPEHQSAPKDGYVYPPAPMFNSSGSAGQVSHRNAGGQFAATHSDGYDTEMDLPEYHNPQIQAGIAELENRLRAKSTQETLEKAIQQHERSFHASASQRWAGQERWQGRENEEMRLVGLLSPAAFIRKLRAAGVDAALGNDLVEDQLRQFTVGAGPEPRRATGQPRLWLNSWSRVGRVGVTAWMGEDDALRARTVTTLQYPIGPEWTLMRFNEYNVPTNERYRGWRTALLVLILSGLVSEEEAKRAFGDPIGPAATFYREQLYKHRAMKLGLRERTA